jgi:hypothetical protein
VKVAERRKRAESGVVPAKDFAGRGRYAISISAFDPSIARRKAATPGTSSEQQAASAPWLHCTLPWASGWRELPLGRVPALVAAPTQPPKALHRECHMQPSSCVKGGGERSAFGVLRGFGCC